MNAVQIVAVAVLLLSLRWAARRIFAFLTGGRIYADGRYWVYEKRVNGRTETVYNRSWIDAYRSFRRIRAALAVADSPQEPGAGGAT